MQMHSKEKRLSRERVKRILVIKLRHFGDVLLTTPLLGTLKQHYESAQIDVLVYRGTEVMLSGNPAVNTCFTVDRNLKHEGIRAQLHGESTLWKALKAQQYDLIINLSDQWRAALYCKFLTSGVSIGFNWPKRDNILWKSCHDMLVETTQHNDQHTVLNNLSILSPLSLPDTDTSVNMCWLPEDEKYVNQLLEQHSLPDYILIHPGARWAFKTWSALSFAALIDHLANQGRRIVLAGGPSVEELQIATTILNHVANPAQVVNLTGQLALPQLAVLIDKATLFIGVDSAPMHMAAARQTPSVALFGPSNLKQWHPWQAPHTLLWAGDYRPLPKPEEIDTNTQERYLDAIPVSDVIAATRKWLS
ncbi:putative lipopolysaccharide heptosyltransferase III [Pectobacterium sp. 21LCBS03]|uniref:putative lipopolysaccharide heptosyltransferase III n=1 Tax=Pectobacterium sp. 21LCBS03 TaxID=2935858 RepID=UPI00200DC0CA|nr:putative lipopolysaccharide heptosyltransferase III [Pectobacterium sp. 21LCBS03]UPY94965.1 putative lipopolysaccharide heptosyltransferase III [Pectobacterium sp. 21LCBS03]